MSERTLVILKPGALERGLVGKILETIEQKGFCVVGLKILKLTRVQASELYKMHTKKPFFKELIQHITSGPVIVMIIEGFTAIEAMRKISGATNPLDAEIGSIRSKYGLTITKNVIHNAESLENVTREIDIFFKPEEIISCKRNVKMCR